MLSLLALLYLLLTIYYNNLFSFVDFIELFNY